MTPDQIIALVLALVGPPSAEPLITPAASDARYPVVATACPGPLAPYEVEGTTVACGRVTVPENHDKPDGRQIDLTFMMLKSHSQAPAADPVIYLHGGPGSGVVNNPILITRFLNEIRDRRHIITFDQRGVDASAGPDSRCYATVANPETLEEAAAAGGSEDKMVRLSAHAIRACLDEIAASGPDVSTINTLENARDVEAQAQALGYASYNLFGTSYGTKLGQEVMRSAPKGLRSVVLDGVWPVQVAFGSDYLMLRATDPSIAALDALLSRHFQGETLAGLRALAGQMTAAQVAQVFDRVGNDNSAIDDALVGQFELQMFACQEDMEINGLATLPVASAQLRDEFGWPEAMIAEIETGLNAAIYGPRAEFQRHPRPGMNDPVTAAIPTRVLQGTLDTQTAPSWGPMLASTLPKSQLAVLPEAGHGTFIFSDCSRHIAAGFLDSPEAMVNTSCTAELIPAFLLPDGCWSK